MNKQKFIMLVGLPGSGKSTYAKSLGRTLKHYKIHSSDEMRKRLFGSEEEQGNPTLVFNTLHKELKADLRNGYSCIYDATNISYKKRKAFLEEIRKIDCIKECVVIATPIDEVAINNLKRDRKVPSNVIFRMYEQFDIPGYFEGWDSIKLYYAKRKYKKYYGTPKDFIDGHITFDQRNEHHSLTLGQHCKRCHDDIATTDKTLLRAAMLHDCGKPYCMTFKDSRGNIGDTAHYYNHERVGSYDSLFYTEKNRNIDVLYAALLIRWHMQMYFIAKNEDLQKKYENMFGPTMWRDLLMLHWSDKNAH